MTTLNPYEILGISTNSSIHEVNAAYRSLLLILHPDKKSRIKWNNDERKEAFIRVREAYKEITNNYNFKNAPEYNIEYNNWDDFVGESYNSNDFDLDSFNKRFIEEKKNIKNSGVIDPYSVGYTKFNTFNNKNKDSKKLIKELSKKIEPINKKSKKKKKHVLVKHNPNDLKVESNNCYEFGLTKIDDFGIKTQSKNSLMGSDLGMIYDNEDEDKEFWEESAKKYKNIYNDNTDINIKMKNMENTRKKLNLDKEYEKAKELEKIEKAKIAKQFEKAKMVQMEKDNFFMKLKIKN